MNIRSFALPLALGSLMLAPFASGQQQTPPATGQPGATQQQTDQRATDHRNNDRDFMGVAIRPYAGGGIGYYWAEEDDFLDEDDFDSDSRSWNAFVGIDIARFFSLEGGYLDLGATGDNALRQEVDGWTLAANAALPVTPWMSPYVRVGRFWWDRDQFLIGEGFNDDGQDWFYGGGLRFTLADHIALRLEYERIEVDNADIDAAWFKFQFLF